MSSGVPPRPQSPQCPHCGHEPVTGRFCSECGTRTTAVGAGAGGGAGARGADPGRERGPDETAERPRVAVDPPTEPGGPTGATGPTGPAGPTGAPESDAPTGPDEATEVSPWGRAAYGAAPPAARWPLYADEVGPAPAAADDRGADTHAATAPPVVPMGGAVAEPEGRRGRTALPWVVGAVVVLLLAGGGALLLLGGIGGFGSDASEGAGSPPTAADEGAGSSTSAPSPSATTPPTTSASPSAQPVQPVDVSGDASVTASATAPPSTDVDGDPVSYAAGNVLDGDPSTAWRAAGDGQGLELTLTLDRPTVVTRLGLVNGYAKSEPGYDGYAANRRVTDVDWVLGDGTVVPQSGLGETTSVQTVAVDEVRTRTVTLRVRGTTAPGADDGRDYTAISEVRVVGDPR